MTSSRSKPELLMPAGSPQKLAYAFAYGACAVYAGVPQFSLRARENEFKDESIFEGIAQAHNLGKKFYLTANILGHNRKIHLFLKKMDLMMQANPDALIMADPGLIYLIKQKYPEIPIHLSVQANTMNWAAVKFWHQSGVSRIILSREVSIDEIKEIKNAVPEMELEAFVHGAICIAHSGRCLLSNYFQHRDANQGLCINSCRWPYKLYTKPEYQNDDITSPYQIFGDFYLEETERPGQLMRIDEDEYGTYIMNARDLMAIEHLKELWEAGVDSFKVEGRTKSIYYLALTTKAYRQAIDDMMQGKPFNPQLINDLNKLHNRGYSPGLLKMPREPQQRYDNGLTDYYTQEFGGTIDQVEPERILVTPRNKLSVGDEIEIISPASAHTISIKELTTVQGARIPVVNAGTKTQVWIPTNSNPAPFSLISKVLKKPSINPHHP